MSKDASEFSLEKAGNMVKPFISSLSFKRIRDYTAKALAGDYDMIKKVRCRLEMWPRWTTMPSDLDLDSKAWGIPIYRVEESFQEKIPVRIEYGSLVLCCPTDETVHWLFQKTNFHIERHGIPHYHGDSSIVWADDDNLGNLLAAKPVYAARFGEDKVAERFWKSIATLISTSLQVREKAVDKVEEFGRICVAGHAESRAETIAEEAKPIREKLTEVIYRQEKD
jgi:hypothetical protein